MIYYRIDVEGYDLISVYDRPHRYKDYYQAVKNAIELSLMKGVEKITVTKVWEMQEGVWIKGEKQ